MCPLCKSNDFHYFKLNPRGYFTSTMMREIETVLADEVLFGKLENGGEVNIGLKKDKLTFKYS